MDHLVFIHTIKSKAEPATNRIKRLLKVLSSYSFNLYCLKGKDMICSDFLSRQKHDNNDPHDVIPISFNMQEVLHAKYYNIHENEKQKYLVQTRSQTSVSGALLPNIHAVDKGVDCSLRPIEQVIKTLSAAVQSYIPFESKGQIHVKSRVGQCRVGINSKILQNSLCPKHT